MRTANRSFQLEKTFPGAFLLQGWLGGIIAGFIYTVAICLWEKPSSLSGPLTLLPYMLSFTSVLGVIKAVLLWLPYRFKEFQPRPVARVLISSVGTGLLAVTTWLTYSNEPTDLAAWGATLLLGGLPTAILIGSRVQPWDLFTFGSIGGERRRSVWGTVGTLPLRFLSLVGLALWILYVVFTFENNGYAFQSTLFCMIPATYLLFSAYISFKSPDKSSLFVTACAANLPVAVLGLSSYELHTNVYMYTQTNLYTSAICASFVIAWSVFLVARLRVRTSEPLNISSKASPPRVWLPVVQPDHHCLGSRFVEWQERHAQ